jgi:endogenous inhibitor of DNA gyrase (YacG/DUF329 family)
MSDILHSVFLPSLLAATLFPTMLITSVVCALVREAAYKYYSRKPMPIEFALLLGQPLALSKCPKCGEPLNATPGHPHEPFMRGQVQRTRRALPWIWKTRPYCAVICYRCKEIVDWEEPFLEAPVEPPPNKGAYRTPETTPAPRDLLPHWVHGLRRRGFKITPRNVDGFFAKPVAAGGLFSAARAAQAELLQAVATIVDGIARAGQ